MFSENTFRVQTRRFNSFSIVKNDKFNLLNKFTSIRCPVVQRREHYIIGGALYTCLDKKEMKPCQADAGDGPGFVVADDDRSVKVHRS